MRTFVAIAADQHRCWYELDASKAARQVAGCILIEHPALRALRARVITSRERLPIRIQVPDPVRLARRVAAAVKRRVTAFRPSVEAFLELIACRRDGPGAAPLNSDLG